MKNTELLEQIPSAPCMAFDPGHERGGIAYWHSGHLHAITTGDLEDKGISFTGIIELVEPLAIIVEQIPLLSSPNAIKLGISYGAMREAVHASDTDCVAFVKPATWQHHHEFPSGMTYARRKKFAHKKAVEVHPGIAIAEPVADAILMLDYLRAITEVECG